MQQAGGAVAGFAVFGDFVGNRFMALGGEVRFVQAVALLMQFTDGGQCRLQDQRQRQANGD